MLIPWSRNRMQHWGRAACLISSLFALFSCQEALAYTQCQSNVQKIWAGDGGYIWLHLTNGGSAVIANNDPNREAVIALATSALLASHQMIVRYAADGVDCTSAGRTDFVGMYLL